MSFPSFAPGEPCVRVQTSPHPSTPHVLDAVNGRAVAQEASRWLPTAAARVRVRAEHVGFVVDKAALGQVFSEYFGFSCQSFHQFLHHHNHPGMAQ
jgi:hypothetical protein